MQLLEKHEHVRGCMWIAMWVVILFSGKAKYHIHIYSSLKVISTVKSEMR